MNVVKKTGFENGEGYEIGNKPISDISQGVKNTLGNIQSQTSVLVTEPHETANEDSIPEAVSDKILNSQYFQLVNKTYREIKDILIEYGVEPLESEKNTLLNNDHKHGLITLLESSEQFNTFGQFTLIKVILKYITKSLPYIDQVKLSNLMKLKATTYQGILLEIKMQKDKSVEHEKMTANKKSYKEANELYEKLNPIKKRLENVTRFTIGLSNSKDIEVANKELNIDECRNLSIKNKKLIEEIFKKLKRDRENLSELQKDEVIIRRLETEIVDASKRVFGTFIRHMCSLYKDKFTVKEHDQFRDSLLNNVNNSEELENFRVKLFKRLVQLKIRQIKEKAKNYGVRQQKK